MPKTDTPTKDQSQAAPATQAPVDPATQIAQLTAIVGALALQVKSLTENQSAPSSPAPSKPAGPSLPPGPIRVRAVSVGTYPEPGGVRAIVRQPGEEFIISGPEHFAPAGEGFGWMELADAPPSAPVPETAVPVTSAPNQVLQNPTFGPTGVPSQIPS